jgi:hypothetical protein
MGNVHEFPRVRVTVTAVAEKLSELVLKAPAGGIFHDAATSPVRSFVELNGSPKRPCEATFTVFAVDGVFDVTVKARS